MSISQIVILSVICGAFVLFAAVLAWGDHQTGKVSHNRAAKPQVAASPDLQLFTSAAAAAASARAPSPQASAASAK